METTTPPPATRRFNWPIFFVVLCAPAILTILAVQMKQTGQDIATVIALIGGALSGIICGGMLGRRIGSTPGLKIALGFLFALMIIPVCVGMSCFGCLVSGFKLDFR